MNKIFKVIYSKVRHCYVVTSEFAKANTKSSTGSERNRTGRKALLTLAIAAGIFCGGLGVASAAYVVHVDESATGTAEVYTKAGVDTLLEGKADKTALETKANASDVTLNRDNISDLKTSKANTSLDNLSDVGKLVIKATMTDELAKKADATNVYTKDEVNTAVANVETKLADYAKTADVDTKLTGKADKATTLAGYEITDAYTRDATDTAITTKVNEEKNARELKDNELSGRIDTLSTTVDSKVSKTDLNTTLGNYYTQAQTNAAIKTAVDNEKNARDTAIKGEVTERNKAISDAIALEVTNRDAAITKAKTELQEKVTAEETARKEEDAKLEGKITENTTAINNEKAEREAADKALSDRIGTVDADGKYIKKSGTNNVSDNLVELDKQAKINADNIQTNADHIKINKDEIARVNGELVKANVYFNTELGKTNNHFNTELGKTNAALQEEGKVRANADAALASDITATNKRTAGIKRDDVRNETTIEGNVTVDSLGNVTAKGQLTGKGVDAGDGAITTTGAVNAGSLEVKNASNLKGDVTMDKKLSVTGDTSLKKTDVDGALNVTGESSLKNTKVDGMLTTTGKATFQEAVEMDKGLTVTNGATKLKETTVDGKLTAGDAELKNTEVKGTLGVTGATTLSGELTAKENATFEKDVTVKGTTNLKNTTVTGDLKVTGTITTDRMVFGNPATDNYTEINKGNITSKNAVLAGDATRKSSSMELDHSKLEVAVADKDSNGHLTMTADKTSIKNSDLAGKNYSEIVVDKDSVKTTVKDEEDNTTSTKSSATEIRNYASDAAGNKTNNVQTATQNKSWAKDKDGNESSIVQTGKDITNTAQSGTITNEAQNIVNNATGDMTNTVGGKLTTTVTGQATEDFNGGLDTNVKGTENHTVTGDQNIHVTGKQTNTVESGQENIISGGQINTITGDQTTTITGNKKETVTENVTEDYKKDLTTTVGGNEIHDVKGTKTETVNGKVTENFKGGQETNVTGDQITNVSGTQTTTATDINRNASSGMIDTVDNAYGTNKETKVAGKTTTEVSIKGTGEKAEYIRGANEAKDELSKGTLKNSETKTVGATSTEITDGTNTSATIQDKTQISGSVTHGTSSAVSNVKADSIDTAVKEGANTSLISQKKNSITSAVGNGTTSTVIQQGDKDITIASNGGTVGIAGKDIINNATYEITNTAGTKITDQVGTNTRVLDNEGITDTVGNTSFKQRIDDIMMEAKNGTIASDAKNITNKATEKISNEAAEIANKASGTISNDAAEIKNTAGRLISNKVGENTYQNIENGKITESIKNGIKQNLTQSDADKTEHSVVNGENVTVNKQTSEELTGAVTNGFSSNVIQNTAISSNNTIANLDAAGKPTKANSVISTVDGTTFSNTEANTVLTAKKDLGKDFTNTTIKGNTITTGQATMDYAEVMKDLGVHGNAKIDGKTTTGSLEVKGESKLTGNVTMESNAIVKKDLTVGGNTNLKNTKVDGTLDVTQKATFGDSVSIAKDLSVDGNAIITGDVTAKSYKVGDKTYIDANGIHANNQKITDVADGSISEGSKDAVNGGQLFETNRRIDQFDSRINEVGANAAAMANLHPMEFDADSKLNVAVGVGNYRNKTATAMGLFYRPNEDVMFNVSSTIGSSDNMIGGGVSFRLGSGGNKLKNKAFADAAEQNKQLKSQVDTLQAQMDALLSVINPNMSKDFPDVPNNHWAYEAVSRLAGNDIIQGYEDGKYHGERTMTRYEMAVIIYKALQKGAKAEAKLVEEFKPELKAIAAHEKA